MGAATPTGARNTLFSYVARLRRIMRGIGVELGRQRGGYLLDIPPETVDLHHAAGLADRAGPAPATDRATCWPRHWTCGTASRWPT